VGVVAAVEAARPKASPQIPSISFGGSLARGLQRIRRRVRPDGFPPARARPFQDAHAEADRLIRRSLGEQVYATAYEQGANNEDPIQLVLNGQEATTHRAVPGPPFQLATHVVMATAVPLVER
jgi:hypothetical protein